ncbi:MAG TPA: TadE/TadG family type IV pilus assembly protein [Vicinamibacteria bacterium]|nr:TadE/TadG family type IV pilus assembly protein [Vicinamibacteria bacterium]
MRTRSREIRSGERGVAVVESALTLLTFFVMLFGLMEGARFLSVQQMISNAAREGARLAVLPLAGTSTMPTDAEIQARVQTYLDAAAISGATVTVQRPILIPTTGVMGEYTRVRVTLNYQPISLAMFSNLSVTLSGESLMRDETSP